MGEKKKIKLIKGLQKASWLVHTQRVSQPLHKDTLDS